MLYNLSTFQYIIIIIIIIIIIFVIIRIPSVPKRTSETLSPQIFSPSFSAVLCRPVIKGPPTFFLHARRNFNRLCTRGTTLSFVIAHIIYFKYEDAFPSKSLVPSIIVSRPRLEGQNVDIVRYLTFITVFSFEPWKAHTDVTSTTVYTCGSVITWTFCLANISA